MVSTLSRSRCIIALMGATITVQPLLSSSILRIG